MYDTILVPLDGSHRAETILPHVERLAQVYESQVVLMHVVEPKPHLVEAMSRANAEAFHQETAESKAYLEDQQARLRAHNIPSRSLITHGPIVEEIINAAEREDAKLIAMVSHGRTGLPRVFYGSIAAGVLHRIDRPLLLVRSADH